MNVLIINIGPIGDVLRTTILLNEFKDENVYWLTSIKNIDILNSDLIKKLFFIENLSLEYYNIIYDLVISLNEEYPFKEDVKYKNIIGVKKDGSYTIDSSKWFDMSLISKFGIEKANELKFENRISYNQILIEMIGKKWNQQKYVMDIEPKDSNKIGLIKNVNGLWKSKKWNYFDDLYEILKINHDVEILKLRDNIKEHINDINNCGIIICPDTFGMHLGILLNKKVLALFNSTSHHEIYNYGNLIKIVSPLYNNFFYNKNYNEKLSNSISIDVVLNQLYETFLK